MRVQCHSASYAIDLGRRAPILNLLTSAFSIIVMTYHVYSHVDKSSFVIRCISDTMLCSYVCIFRILYHSECNVTERLLCERADPQEVDLTKMAKHIGVVIGYNVPDIVSS